MMRRVLVVLLGLGMAVLSSCSEGGETASKGEPSSGRVIDHGTVIVKNPIDVLFTDSTTDVPIVLSQCDNHGHRVFASRHPEDFVVIDDPSCPDGPAQ
jgi:hypothetical protein